MENTENKLYLIRLGEISLKGLNRGFFEKKLKNNIKLRLRPYHSFVEREKGRIFINVENSCPDEKIEGILKTSCGVVGFSRAYLCNKDYESIAECVSEIIKKEPFSDGKGTFKVFCKRADKSFPMTSYEIEAELGGVVLNTYPEMKVNVHNPQKEIHVEIREKAYVYTSPVEGPGGLPCGCAGKGLLLLSGGIDSPVAGFRMAKRGLKLDCLYFHAYPYTSDQALQKVKDLAYLLGKYTVGTSLVVVNFTETELWIKDHSKEEEHTLMMRACMMKVANKIAAQREAKVLVTGEALGQVASQTLEAMCFTTSMSDLPVLRPLVGMDKQEIVDTAVKIGTYETSILPYDDCCVIFSPKHPITKPVIEIEKQSYSEMDIETILDKCVSEAEVFEISC